MERDHKLSPKWRGPFPLLGFENPFQVHYKDRGKEKIAHVRHPKRFNSVATNDKKACVIANNDIISNDSMDHQGEGPGDDEDAGDLLTQWWVGGGGESMEGTEAIMQKRRKRGRSFRCQSLPHRSRKMSFEHIELCFQGSVRAFMEITSFVAWVNSIQGPSQVIGIRGVSAMGGPDNQELSDFMTSVLCIEGATGRWRRRRIRFLQKRFGHHLTWEGAVRRTAKKAQEEGENFSPAERQENQITSTVVDVGLQEAPPTVMTSEAQGYINSQQADELRLCPISELLQLLLSVFTSESLQQLLQQQQHLPN